MMSLKCETVNTADLSKLSTLFADSIKSRFLSTNQSLASHFPLLLTRRYPGENSRSNLRFRGFASCSSAVALIITSQKKTRLTSTQSSFSPLKVSGFEGGSSETQKLTVGRQWSSSWDLAGELSDPLGPSRQEV